MIGRMPFESPGSTFMNTGDMIFHPSTKFVFHWDILILNLKYFFIGRFTGLIPYFLPAAVAMVLACHSKGSGIRTAERRPGRLDDLHRAGVVSPVYIPSNYHGGVAPSATGIWYPMLRFFHPSAKAPEDENPSCYRLRYIDLTGPIASIRLIPWLGTRMPVNAQHSTGFPWR